MKILVTGCSGFIGSHLTKRLLENGHEVVGIDCFLDNYDIKFKKANLENISKSKYFSFFPENILKIDLEKLLENVEYIFHQAALPGVRPSWGDKFDDYLKNNVLATQKLLEAAKTKKIKKFIYASSSSVYGDAPLPAREEGPCFPYSPYGLTKLAGEKLCYIYAKNYNVPYVILRYFTVYGPGQREDMAFHQFIKKIEQGQDIEIYGDGTQTRDFTYISDVIEANILALKKAPLQSIYNIGGGTKISVNEAIEILSETIGKKAKIKYLPRQKGDVFATLADINKAKQELGYQPQINLKEGLKEEVNWLRSFI